MRLLALPLTAMTLFFGSCAQLPAPQHQLDSPPPGVVTPDAPPVPPANGPCGHALAKATPASHPIAAATAILSATIIVGPENASPATCHVLLPGDTIHVAIHDKVEFVANDAPQLQPAASDVVAVSTRPGPPEAFAGLMTAHVIVTLTAKQPGSLKVTWADCSGTGC